MANDLYDTGAPRRVIVVNEPAPETAVTRAQRYSEESFDRMMENFVDYLARHATRNAQRRQPPEATRAGPVIDAEFEEIPEAPPRRQLAAPKPTRRKK